ncbi:hypothetical protein [Streptomyces synnematoformans]|uniref:hypothetical protein n=1 Tax=Streptomyces synnematoformans TaxID=415721 RepID=UPI0031DF0FB1
MTGNGQCVRDARDLLVGGDCALASGQLPHPFGLDVAGIGDLYEADSAPLPSQLEHLAEFMAPQRGPHIGAVEDVRR